MYDESEDEESEEESDDIDGLEEDWSNTSRPRKKKKKHQTKMGNLSGSPKSTKADWWKGLQNHDGLRVICKTQVGTLHIDPIRGATIQCVVDGRRQDLTLSAFEIASGHHGKNARKSIRLEESGVFLGVAAET